MTQSIEPYSTSGAYPQPYNSKTGASINPSGFSANQYTEPPLIGPMQNGYGNAPYDLSHALNLDPLAGQVYSNYQTQPYIYPNTQPGLGMPIDPNANPATIPPGNGSAPINTGQVPPTGAPAGQPPPPSYVDDSPAGFAANVIDPMVGDASKTFTETMAMVEEAEKKKEKK